METTSIAFILEFDEIQTFFAHKLLCFSLILGIDLNFGTDLNLTIVRYDCLIILEILKQQRIP